MDEKVTITRVGSNWHIRFPKVEGLDAWAVEEIKATFSPATESQKWFYFVKATRQNTALVKRTAPIAIKGDEYWQRLSAEIPDKPEPVDRYAGQVLPQPARRVGDLWDHQLGGYQFAKESSDIKPTGCGMLAMGMGTGKSKTLIDIIQNGPEGLNLILCPSRVLGVWRGQFRQFAPQTRLLIKEEKDTVAKFVAKLKEFVEWGKRCNFKDGFVVVVNYESARLNPLRDAILRINWTTGALDESHRAKDPSGVTGKFIQKLQMCCSRRLCLTGTPMPHSPADLFSQFYFISPQAFGRSYVMFSRRYKISGYHNEAIGWRNKQEMSRIYHSLAYEVSSDVLDLPPMLVIEQEFSLSIKAMGIYKKLWRDLVAEVEGGTCTADNALVKLIRAQQITSGFLPLDRDIGDELQQVAELDTAKADMLGDVLQDVDPAETVVVFCKHRYDLDRVRDQAEKLGRTYGEVSGRQNDLTRESKIPEGFSVFGAQIQSGGVGVDFTRACLGVLYSIDFSLGNYEQILKRLHRPGQKNPVRFIKLIAEGTVDRRIYNALAQRRQVVDSIVEAIKGGDILGEG